jgi:hypothetical protein
MVCSHNDNSRNANHNIWDLDWLRNILRLVIVTATTVSYAFSLFWDE